MSVPSGPITWTPSYISPPHPAAFDVAALRVFRGDYPNGRNYLVTPSGDPADIRRFGTLNVRVCTPTELHA